MLRNRLYYSLKPWLPHRLRMALRRGYARRIRKRCGNVWPILESAGRKPDGWPGWPDGRQFTLVLTHDVESQAGVDNVRALAELEMSLGFRSSFNFVPEGSYRVPDELRHWLADNGFEVGVHDHRHDGRLYRCRDCFRQSAQRINHYLKEWNAVGFRSGFMLHKLDWLHDLNITYDASTFDTDPFEPQPDGVGTIFPFWVPAPGGKREAGSGKREAQASRDLPTPISDLRSPISARGYVELPYTLVQDSTLFLHLGEKNIEIWKRKLDWIAAKGGMALLNLHPDYLAFNGRLGTLGAFEAAHYRSFLEHMRERYQEKAWHALPRAVADYIARPRATALVRRHPLRVAMLSHSFYEIDNRVLRYAETLAGRGDQVEVIALRLEPALPRHELRQGVELTRLLPRLSGEGSGRVGQLLSVLAFTCLASAVLTWRHLRKRYDLVHVHNIPDFIVFAAWLPRLTGSKVILDIHDLVPEFYAAKFAGASESKLVRVLKRVERASARFAHHVIVANDLWKNRLLERSVPAGRCSAIINHVDTDIFKRHERTRGDDRIVLLFHGSLQRHQGLDVAVRALALLRVQFPTVELHIYGRGPARAGLNDLVDELGLAECVKFQNPVSIHDIPAIIANADVGVVPKRADSFGNEAYSTKVMEFMSQGVPVVASRTRVDTYYFSDDMICFFESGNAEDMARAIAHVLGDEARRSRMVSNALQHVASNNWAQKKGNYLSLVNALVGAPTAPLRDHPGPGTAPAPDALQHCR